MHPAVQPMNNSLTLSEAELLELTGYERPTKQLNVLHARGFTRAFIGRNGVVLERSHYEAVSRGELQGPRKGANLSIFRKAA